MGNCVLELQNISLLLNDFPVLKDINCSFESGKLYALLGENGAGKSSLIKIMSGLLPEFQGTIKLNGKTISITSPWDASNYGIITLQQEPYLFDQLSIAENLLVNNISQKKQNKVFLPKSQIIKNAQEIINSLGFSLDCSKPAYKLNLAQKRMVEIAKISTTKPKILFLDEPQSALDNQGVSLLLDIIKKFTNNGVAVVIATHHFKKISKIVDHTIVLRDGQIIKNTNNCDDKNLEKIIWGQYYPDKYPKLNVPKGNEVICVENLCTEGLLKNINFNLMEGEILGVAGLVGSGRTQLAKAIFGSEDITNGTIYLDRLKTKIKSPGDAISKGIAYITEDCTAYGLFDGLSALDNIFSAYNAISKDILMDKSFQRHIYKKYCEYVNLKLDSTKVNVETLSGGTRQKILMLRWLISSAHVFIFDEPTKGIDLPSKLDIYNLMNDIVSKKAGILLISSSFEELIGMCDRIIILTDGQVSCELKRGEEFNNLYKYVVSPENKS